MTDAALYNRDILRLAASLVAGDRLEHPDGTAESRSPICGSRIQADVAFAADGAIAALAFRANACALGQASAAILRANAVGSNLAAISAIRTGIADGLSGNAAMPGDWAELALLTPAKDYPSRHAAILLPYDALLAAAQDMKLAS
jgi:NifU-like protein involved in Fe-S cluster formation